MFPGKNRSKNSPVIIRRRTEKELQVAIAELEKRGYTLIRRGVDSQCDQGAAFKRTEQLTVNLGSPGKTLNAYDNVQLMAVMKKIPGGQHERV